MNDAWFVSPDWAQHNFPATRNAGADTVDDGALFNETLARLFHGTGDAGAPPRYLRAKAENAVAYQATASDATVAIDARVALKQLREITSLAQSPNP